VGVLRRTKVGGVQHAGRLPSQRCLADQRQLCSGPLAGLDGMEEFEAGVVEHGGLFEVDGVAALGEDDEAGVRDVALHEDGGLDARFVLIADEDEGGYLQRLHFGLPVEDRRAAGLDAAHGVR